MRYFLATLTAGLLTLTLVTNAPAQSFGGGYYGAPGVYSQQYYQPAYPPVVYAQPQVGAAFSYSTPSFGLGINIGPSYVPSVGIYSRPVYGPSYYPARYGYNNYHHYSHNHYHHGHR